MEETLRKVMSEHGFDAAPFIDCLREGVEYRIKRGKPHRKIRYFFYHVWALNLKKKEVGPENCHYKFPKEVLAFIRDIADQDIVGELREDAFQVDMETFCEAMGIPKVE